jgi:hypothetical protein
MNREGQSGNERREVGLVLLGKNGGIVCYMHRGNRALGYPMKQVSEVAENVLVVFKYLSSTCVVTPPPPTYSISQLSPYL